MIHSGKSDIYGWPLGFLDRIIVFFHPDLLHSVSLDSGFYSPWACGSPHHA